MDNVNITASNSIDNVVIEITPNVTIVEVTSGGGGDDSNYAKLDEANTFTGNPQDIVGGSLRIKDGFLDTNRGIEYFERDIDPTLGFPTVVPNFRHTIYADESKIRFERTGGTTGEPVLSVFEVDHLTRVLDFKETPTINGVPIGTGGGAVDSVNGQTGVVVLDADDIDDIATSNKFVTSSDLTVLSNTSGVNTGDETTVTIQTKRPLKTIEGQSLEGSGNIDLNKSDIGLSNVDNTSDINKPVSTAQQTALNLKQNKNLNFGTKTASFTLALTDNQDIIEVDSVSDIVLTVPTNASVAFEIGYRIRGFQLNTGAVTITPSGGVMVLSPNNRTKTAYRYSQFELIKKGSDTWILSGDII